MADSVSWFDLFTIQTFRGDPAFREESLAMLVSVWQEPSDCGSKLKRVPVRYIYIAKECIMLKNVCDEAICSDSNHK